MKILLTGGAGFIGSHLVRRYIDAGHEVVVLDNLILGRREFLADFETHPRFRFVNSDLYDLERTKIEMVAIDLVVHLAANSDISQGAERTDVDMRNGTIATYNVLEAMRVNGVKHLIFASTSAIYGEAETKPTPEAYGPLFPISFYGASKLACEAMVSAFAYNCGIQTWVYRFANIVGSHATHGAIYDFISRLSQNPRRLEVLGNGTQRKSYLHVSDCVDGILFGYEKSRLPFQCFNLASRGVSSVRFIAETVSAAMRSRSGQDVDLIFGETDRGWTGDVPFTYLDGAKFESLGWKAQYESDGAVEKAVSEVMEEVVLTAKKNRAGFR